MVKSTMGTVDKALSLLRHFSVQQPEIGLSALSRLAGYDKTTILRCMNALERNGFVEQNADTKKYRLGLAPINLARIREHSFPLLAILQPHIDQLARLTGETAHASVITGNTLMTALVAEPDRATRVYLDPSAPMPVHATASGLAIVAHMPRDIRDAMIAQTGFAQFTPSTPTDQAAIDTLLEDAKRLGYARVDQAYEDDVTGTAAAFFNAAGLPVGALAVAAMSSRFDVKLSEKIVACVMAAAHDVTRELGGTPPSPHTPNAHQNRSAP